MSPMFSKVALVATVALTAGLGVSTSADAAVPVQDCGGMFAPVKSGENTAPVTADDTGSVLSGDFVTLDVLANDADADADGLSVVSATQGNMGYTCVNSDGSVTYYAYTAVPSGTDTFEYAVTDGDSYRTASVTISVEGVKAFKPKVTTKLVVKKGKVTRAAKLSFTNTNTRTVEVMAGNFNRAPDVDKLVKSGVKLAVTTKRARLDYVIYVKNDAGDSVYVVDGSVNTKTGKVTVSANSGRHARSAARAITWGR